MSSFSDYRDHVGSLPDKQFKSTLFRSDRLLLGLNCLERGQEQHPHVHADQDKFYFVLEGEGEFVVGEEKQVAGEGSRVGAGRRLTWCKESVGEAVGVVGGDCGVRVETTKATRIRPRRHEDHKEFDISVEGHVVRSVKSSSSSA